MEKRGANPYQRGPTLSTPFLGYHHRVASLEDHAIQRDKRFLVRLVLLLVIGAVFGLFVFDHLTGSEVANCAARSMGG